MNKLIIVLILIGAVTFAQNLSAQDIDFVSSTLWARPSQVQTVGNYAYCNFVNGLMILDISNPSFPTHVSQLLLNGDDRYIHIANNHAYIANGDIGLQVVDVTDPSSPSIVGGYVTQNFASKVVISEDYAFVTVNWVDGMSGDNFCKVLIIDISIPSNPSYVS